MAILRGAVGLERDRNVAVDGKRDGHQMTRRPGEQPPWHWNRLKSSPCLQPPVLTPSHSVLLSGFKNLAWFIFFWQGAAEAPRGG